MCPGPARCTAARWLLFGLAVGASRAPAPPRWSPPGPRAPPGPETTGPHSRFADVEAKLKEIVAEQLGVEQASITAEASFASDLGADSLDVVEMARHAASTSKGPNQGAATPRAPRSRSDVARGRFDRPASSQVMKIEEEFGVELPDERAEEVQNLSDAVRVVNDLLG